MGRTKKKKGISQRQFDRRVKVFGLIVPIVAVLISTGGTLWVAGVFSPSKQVEVQYSIAPAHLVELRNIRTVYDSLRAIPDSSKSDATLDTLHNLALREFEIMREYDPGFTLRDPLDMYPQSLPSRDFGTPILAFLLLVIVMFLMVRGGGRLILSRYNVEE